MATRYSVAVLGLFAAIGKSALTLQYVQGQFVESDPEIEDVYRKICVVDEGLVVLDVLDTAMQEGSLLVRDIHINDGFILAYSITSRPSFEHTKTIYQEILRIKGQDTFPMVLVGTKCDAEPDRQVSKIEGQELAKEFGCQFFETSAKHNINVGEAFSELVREIRTYKNESAAAIRQSTKLHDGGCFGKCTVL